MFETTIQSFIETYVENRFPKRIIIQSLYLIIIQEIRKNDAADELNAKLRAPSLCQHADELKSCTAENGGLEQ